MDGLSPEEMAALAYQWEGWTARPDQTEPPGDWTYWLILAGRGYGKTRTGGEWVRKTVATGLYEFVNLIGATSSDVRDIMVEGESGLLRICPPWERPVYRVTKSKLEWPNGAESLLFTADEPERLRGKQHMALWADELAAWRYPEAWEQAMYGLRLGPRPRAVISTTPKPIGLLRHLMSDPKTVVTRGTTYDNRDNLAPSFYDTIIRSYEGTRRGRQELLAELLEDVPGALWTLDMLDRHRVTDAPRDLARVIVGVDPAASADPETGSSETGIVVVARCGWDQRDYVLADWTILGSPLEWASAVINAYRAFGANLIVAEKNQGGDMVRHTINTVDRNAPVKLVAASRGKYTRAEPVAALYEQGRVSHVGVFGELERQMTTWTPDDPDSPDRMDALVWAMTELSVTPRESRQYAYVDRDAREPVIRRGGLVLRGRHHIDEPSPTY